MQHRQRLAEAGRKVASAEAGLEQARKALAQSLRDALADGVPLTQAAVMAGIGRQVARGLLERYPAS